MVRHIFLTGEKQIGKSTLLRGTLEALHIAATGYRTEPLDIAGERKGFVLHSLLPLPPFENDCPAILRIGQRQHIPVLPVFELLGPNILERSLAAPSPVILMDELGKVEREAACFQAAVLRCLDSGKHVLGVLQQGTYPFFNTIAARPDVCLLSVTRENRDALAASLIGQVRGLLGL